MMKVVAVLAISFALAHAVPSNFMCSRSMKAGELKPMDAPNTIAVGDDRSIDMVGGVACGGSVVNNTEYTLAVTIPEAGYQWLIEAEGVKAMFGNPFAADCKHRESGAGETEIKVTFMSTGTAILRMLASLGASNDATTLVSEDCMVFVCAAACGTNEMCNAGTCRCATGFAGDPCTDVNECDAATSPCDATNAVCANTDGSFTCTCNAGWMTTDQGKTCTDIDECAVDDDNNCDTNADCTDTDGSFTCQCRPGFSMTDMGVTCTEIDECASDTDNCADNEVCTNTVGSFTCAETPAVTETPRVNMVVELPYTVETFTEELQLDFRTAVASAAAVDVAKVIINKITAKTRRRALLQSSIDVDLSVITDTADAAEELADSDKLSIETLNTALEAVGVEQITAITTAATVVDPNSAASALSAGVCLGAAAATLVAAAVQRV